MSGDIESRSGSEPGVVGVPASHAAGPEGAAEGVTQGVGQAGVERAAQEGLGRPTVPDRSQERALERPLRVSPVYTPQVIEEIQDKAQLGRYRIRGFGTLRAEAAAVASTTSRSCRPA